MKTISLYTPEANLVRGSGYPDAAFNIITSMQANRAKVLYSSPEPEIQINFSQPPWYADVLRSKQFQIGYTPWESTRVPEDWPDLMRQCDAIWATSTWNKQVYEDLGFKVDHVYPHGIDPMWEHKAKKRGRVLKFLHVGEPASRKGGQLTFDAFRAAFGGDPEVCLYFKTKDRCFVRNKVNGSIVGGLPKNVKLIRSDMDEEDLVQLFQQVDFLVYPSAGEGFGFIPLQGLATGTPTICTGAWAEYSNFLGPLSLASTPGKSPWQEMHPGNVWHPDKDHLVDLLRYCRDNVDELQRDFLDQAPQLKAVYDWNKLSKEALKTL